MVKELVKRWISGTPFEKRARSIHRRLRRTAPTLSDMNALCDAQTTAVMERVLDRRSNCIDVGCHEGVILDVILGMAPEGIHYAFEPLPNFYSALVQKFADMKNVHLVEAALSDAAGTASFQHVITNPAYSGLLKRRYNRPHEDVVEIQVNLRKLDDILPRGYDLHFMKIDVEGAELQVLRGAMDVLRRCRPHVVFEHGLGAADCYGTRPEHMFDLFANCGLRVSLMGDWLASNARKTLSREAFADEFDMGRSCYFIAHI